MEATRRLWGVGCVGLSVVTTMAAAIWYSGPPQVHAAQGNGPASVGGRTSTSANGPAAAPSPPAIRPDIYAARSAPSAPPPVQATTATRLQAAPTPPPVRPDIRTYRDTRDVREHVVHATTLPAAPLPSQVVIPTVREAPLIAPELALPTREAAVVLNEAPLPLPVAPLPAPELALPSREAPSAIQEMLPAAGQATEAADTRLAFEQSLSDTNRLRSMVQTPLYPATGEPTVSQTALLRASDAQPGGPEGMLDGNLLLVEAHELAETADSIVQFTRIVELCHAGLQAGVGTEAVQFAHELTSWAYNRRGEAYDALGEASKALVDFNAAVKHQPARWQAVHNRGVSLAQAGRVREAIDDFSRTIQLQPRYAKAYSNRAAIAEQQGKFREALVDFQKAAELDHTMATAHAGIGRALLQLNRHREALIALDEAIRIDQENPTYLTSRGDVYSAMGDYESALDDYGKAIEVDPTFATAYRNGSWLLATCPDDRFRDAENAVIGAEKALDLAFGDRHLCLDTLAAAHANAGDFDKAVTLAEQAIEEAPRGVQSFYATRLKMYHERKPFRTPSAQQAGYVEIAQ